MNCQIVRMTNHAHERCREMGVMIARVQRAGIAPEKSYKAPEKYGAGRVIHCRDGICVCLFDEGRGIGRVETVLWDRPGEGFVRNSPKRIAKWSEI